MKLKKSIIAAALSCAIATGFTMTASALCSDSNGSYLAVVGNGADTTQSVITISGLPATTNSTGVVIVSDSAQDTRAQSTQFERPFGTSQGAVFCADQGNGTNVLLFTAINFSQPGFKVRPPVRLTAKRIVRTGYSLIWDQGDDGEGNVVGKLTGSIQLCRFPIRYTDNTNPNAGFNGLISITRECNDTRSAVGLENIVNNIPIRATQMETFFVNGDLVE